MLKKYFKNKWLLSVLSIAFHRGTLQAKIPIDYTEDPYAINMPNACQ